MSYYFFDTSALVKRYISEIGSDWIRSLIRRDNTIFVARITSVEVVSAVMRRSREGNVTSRTAQAVRLMLHRHAGREYQTIQLTDEIIQKAEDLLRVHPLRAYDAVQLASALQIHHRLSSNRFSELVFLSSDNRLLNVAQSEGLLTDNPMLHL